MTDIEKSVCGITTYRVGNLTLTYRMDRDDYKIERVTQDGDRSDTLALAGLSAGKLEALRKLIEAALVDRGKNTPYTPSQK